MTEQSQRIGILGGSFDPIHFGHIKPTLELIDKFQLQRVHFIPCKVSPFKEVTYASDKQRWDMVNLITANQTEFVADARELNRSEPSYSYLTLRELRDELGDEVTLFWILGADALEGLESWFKADEIMRLCHMLILARPGYNVDTIVQKSPWLQDYFTQNVESLEKNKFGKIYASDTAMLEISSTSIRETIQAGQQPRYMLPGNVWNYIKRNELYLTQ